MYSTENYIWGLVGYYLGVLLLLAASWRVCKVIPWKHPRRLLLLLLAVVFLVPVRAYPELQFLAPAFFVAIFEGITSTEEGSYLRGLIPLIVSYLVAVAVYIAINGYLLRRKRPPVATSEQTEGNIHGST